MDQALKKRKSETIAAAWQTTHNMYTQAQVAPNTYVMDNEISYEFLADLTKNNTTY